MADRRRSLERTGLMLNRRGSIKLFDAFGINVYLHWTWFVAAIFLFQQRVGEYTQNQYLWGMLEYGALFGLVLLHEFGHALACRQVGGVAHEIVLWPLGGVAFVSPPERPGATLWSIAAGPLVNVVLAPVLYLLKEFMLQAGVLQLAPNAVYFVIHIYWINMVLLIFNLVPVYPLDGGQILRSLLWFVLGRARSLMVACGIGFVGVLALGVIAWVSASLWLGLITFFAFTSCWNGWQQAKELARFDNRWQMPDKSPLRFGFSCPSCHNAPQVGNFWVCSHCQTAFDTFETNARCPACGATFDTTRCRTCGASFPLGCWRIVPPAEADR
jgi:Zn-dependent protease